MNGRGLQIHTLSAEEIIHYIESGIIESVPGEVVLKIISKMKELEEELEEGKKDYSRGYDDAIREAINKLENM